MDRVLGGFVAVACGGALLIGGVRGGSEAWLAWNWPFGLGWLLLTGLAGGVLLATWGNEE